MSHAPRLIADVLSLAADRGESLTDVAKALGVDPTTLMHYRSGRRRLTMPVFAAIVRRYGADTAILDAAVDYVRSAYPSTVPGELDELRSDLPVAAVETLRKYVDRLPQESVTTGRGLYLLSPNATTLSSAAAFLARSFERANVIVARFTAGQKLAASDRRRALACPVLLVERTEFLSEQMAVVLLERARIVRPVVVTSMQAPTAVADAHLRRVFLALTRLVEIEPIPSHASDALPPAVSAR